ncbi:M20 family metallopeptidase [Actinotalea sp.]|uniref:M20 metallopeptidase family protein n=1 Tax=Actinotalea sp. TaxID=1872145 RepID=UPI002C7B056A|nr:M20 family metallopeptidase [Actinotalea sp.]HQY34698.1 M20 family metallopeptidase [Actinotalea sp.]HRA51814.1 M20 family metallopeptidase [Actinotalea sp.]
MTDPTLLADALAMAPDLVALRRDLHRIPEIGLHLPLTQARVLAALEGLDLEVTTGTGLSSVVAVLRGARPGPAVLLRGDMDALPVTEDSAEPVRSEHDGAMHACGHDLHMAGLVGAARLLAARRADLAGSVVLMFQPGEEGDHGARLMIEEGVLDAAGERVVAGYALHVLSAMLPAGLTGCRPGTMLAAADQLFVTVRGRGGHGSMPHLAADPVTVAAEIVLALQVAVTRQFDAQDPVVVTVGRLSAGTADNIIPATAEIAATVRTFSPEAHAVVGERLTRVVEHLALAHGLTADVRYVRGYPTTQNTPAEVERAERVVTALTGPHGYVAAPRPMSGSEDFSYVLQRVPGAYLGLGAAPAGSDPETAAYNHAPQATFDESALPVGAAILAGLALDRLAQG